MGQMADFSGIITYKINDLENYASNWFSDHVAHYTVELGNKELSGRPKIVPQCQHTVILEYFNIEE